MIVLRRGWAGGWGADSRPAAAYSRRVERRARARACHILSALQNDESNNNVIINVLNDNSAKGHHLKGQH